jgi:two-component system, sensor histidine kinase
VTETEPRAIHADVRQSLHILIIEDNQDGRETLRALLTLYGYQVDVAADGAEGLEMALRLHPDAALVDIGLPRLDGYQVAECLRAARGNSIRLLACTAYGDVTTRIRASEAGFDAFLVKPVDPEHIVAWLTAKDE